MLKHLTLLFGFFIKLVRLRHYLLLYFFFVLIQVDSESIALDFLVRLELIFDELRELDLQALFFFFLQLDLLVNIHDE